MGLKRCTSEIKTDANLHTCLPVVNGSDEPVAGIPCVSPPLEVVDQRVQKLFQVLLVATCLVDRSE